MCYNTNMNTEITIEAYLETITGKRDVLHTKGITSIDLPRYMTSLYDPRDAELLGASENWCLG